MQCHGWLTAIISPFLELAKRLINRNSHIYSCSTPIILSSIDKKKNKLFSSDRKYYHEDDSIQLVELQLPSSPEFPSQISLTHNQWSLDSIQMVELHLPSSPELPSQISLLHNQWSPDTSNESNDPLKNAYEISAPNNL